MDWMEWKQDAYLENAHQVLENDPVLVLELILA